MCVRNENFVFVIHTSEENSTACKEDGRIRRRREPTQAEFLNFKFKWICVYSGVLIW